MSRRIDAVLDLIVGPEVLDLGCAGHIVDGELRPSMHERIRERYPSVWGLDSSPEAVQRLRARGWDNLHVGDAQDFELDKKFDTIVAGEVIEHVARPGETLKCAVRHLKEDGRIVLTTPYVFGLHNWLYATVRFPKTCSNPEHIHWFCPSTLTALAEREGLAVTDWMLIAEYSGAPNKVIVRAFYALMRTLGRLLPMRIRGTTMVFLLSATGRPT